MKLSKKSLHYEIFRTLRDRIINMEYPPGAPLSEKELCTEFGVSRTPLREATRKLEEMHLVAVIPRYGTHVTEVNINEVRCAFEVKIKLEGLAGEAAARRITVDKLEALKKLIDEAGALQKRPEGLGHKELVEMDARFHAIVYEASQNDVLTEMLENLHHRCARLWYSAMTGSISPDEVLEQLKHIYQALQSRDPEKAAAWCETHVKYFIDKLKQDLL